MVFAAMTIPAGFILAFTVQFVIGAFAAGLGIAAFVWFLIAPWKK